MHVRSGSYVQYQREMRPLRRDLIGRVRRQTQVGSVDLRRLRTYPLTKAHQNARNGVALLVSFLEKARGDNTSRIDDEGARKRIPIERVRTDRPSY